MLIITAKETDNIERILKKYRNKVEKVGLMKEIRKRLQYKKPSTRSREEKQKAIYTARFKRQNT